MSPLCVEPIVYHTGSEVTKVLDYQPFKVAYQIILLQNTQLNTSQLGVVVDCGGTCMDNILFGTVSHCMCMYDYEFHCLSNNTEVDSIDGITYVRYTRLLDTQPCPSFLALHM